jgi:cytidine deaminase
VDPLVQAATEVVAKAYAPYSHFSVGAAVMTASGKIYSGCNVENVSYGLTICAERVAIFKAVSEGEQELCTLALVTDTLQPVAPCGACRQVMAEFGIKTVIMANTKGQWRQSQLDQLLPEGFGKKDLPGEDLCK